MIKPEDNFKTVDNILSEGPTGMTVTELCSLMGVSRSGYYNWKTHKSFHEAQEQKDKEDFDLILQAYKKHPYKRGARGIYMTLLHDGCRMNLKKIRRLMKKFGLKCPVRKANPYRRMAKALKTSSTADNLVKREFEEHGPRKILLTDITYIKTRFGMTYLSTILDSCTKEVLAWQLSDSLEVDFVLATVAQLLENHKSELAADPIIHSDQGFHYTSHRFIDLVKSKRLRQSMSRKGNCWDNAPQESFFGHMKDDLKGILLKAENIEQVKAEIGQWMDYYNHDRYQWDLARLSPCEYYQYITTGNYPLKEIPGKIGDFS
jgi:transposase InsO family protein